MSRVYFISSGNEACFNVRCLLPLQANGWDGDRTSINPGAKTPENKSLAARSADIVVFHRPNDPQKLKLMRFLKEHGQKIVFDNDDTEKDTSGVRLTDYINKERVKKHSKVFNIHIDQAVIEADLVTCTTEFLAEEYRKLNPNVVVLPNCIDPFYFEEPLRNEADVVRIGVSGSVGSTSDLELFTPIVKHFEGDKRVQLVFFALPANRFDDNISKVFAEDYKWLDSVDIEWHPLVEPHKYYDKLNSLKLDIMLIPRVDNYFNRCKSNLKFLETSMFEVPIIAQGFSDGKSPYQIDPDDTKHMVIVNDNKDWIPRIEDMIKDKEGRRLMGKAAHDYVLNKYDIEKNGWRWVKAYESIK